MNYSAKTIVLLTSLMISQGCANTVEMRTISQWMAELEEEDLAQVRDRSSQKLDDMAFPLSGRVEPFAAVEVLKLPKGQLDIKKVEGDDAEKKVLVEIKEKKEKRAITRKLVFKLIRDGQSGKWVVDDVYRPEKIRGGDTAYRSIAQQMSLLLAVQEFEQVWSQGDREDVLSGCSPRLARVLADLPPADLGHILSKIHGKHSLSGKFKPQARMSNDTAEISFRKNGRTIVAAFRQFDGQWKVDDVAAKSSRKSDSGETEITSVQDLAKVLVTANTFRDAYERKDKQALSKICTVQFFQGALETSDLSAFPLPEVSNGEGNNADIKIIQGRADYVVKGEREVLQISLVRSQDDTPGAPRIYHVDDVTVFDWNHRQEKKLAAVFTAHQAMRIYSAALADRDLNMLEFYSTRDFQQRAWKRLNSESIHSIPLDDIPAVVPVVENTVFQGPLTEITVNQGGRPVTYVLRALRGKMKVDDVLFPAVGRPDSLKETIELLLPIHEFAAGLESGDLNQVAEFSTREFNGSVWSQCRRIPQLGFPAADHLRTTLQRVENTNPEHVQVILGNQNLGAIVWLLKQNHAYRVDDVRIIRGPDQIQDQVQLKRHVRLALAEGKQETGEDQQVVPADFEVIGEEMFPESLGSSAPVQQATEEPPVLRRP